MKFEPEELIKKAIKRHKDNIAVACSFGKDSIVMLHIALKLDPNIKVVFANTGVEFPETLEYKDKLKKEWNLNLFETKPIKTFWECLDEYGLPRIRGEGKFREPKCCYYCKNKPAQILYKKLGIRAVFVGITRAESHQRAMLIERYNNCNKSKDDLKFCGQRYYTYTQDLWKYLPIAYWKDKDIWDYFKINNIPINEVYTKWNGIYKRCGCLPCTSYRHWEDKLSVTHPILFEKLKQHETKTSQTSSKAEGQGGDNERLVK